MDPNLESIIVGMVAFVFTFVSALIVDRLGRRPLLFVSDLFMAISTGFLGLYFYLQSIQYDGLQSIRWLPILSLCVFVMAFAIGYGAVSYTHLDVYKRQA